MSVVYDKEGIDPCSGYAHYCERIPVTSFRTGINDDEYGLHQDYEKWLEALAPTRPSGSIDTMTPARPVPRNRGNDADARLKRHGPRRAAVVAVTNGRQDGFATLTRTFGTWERILCQLDG